MRTNDSPNNLRNYTLLFTPFIVVVVLAAVLALSPLTGIGPPNTTYLIFALVSIVVGLVVGVVSLFIYKNIGIWPRVLIGVLYLPVVVLSLLLAGI